MNIEEAAQMFHDDHKREPWFVSVGVCKDKIHVYYRQKRGQTIFVMAPSAVSIEWHKVTGKVRALITKEHPDV